MYAGLSILSTTTILTTKSNQNHIRIKSESNQTQIRLKSDSNQTQIRLKSGSNQTQIRIKSDSNPYLGSFQSGQLVQLGEDDTPEIWRVVRGSCTATVFPLYPGLSNPRSVLPCGMRGTRFLRALTLATLLRQIGPSLLTLFQDSNVFEISY